MVGRQNLKNFGWRWASKAKDFMINKTTRDLADKIWKILDDDERAKREKGKENEKTK